MGGVKTNIKKTKKSYKPLKPSIEQKYLIWTLFVLTLLALFSGGFGFVTLIQNKLSDSQQEEFVCGDGTPYNSCSSTKPYICLDGKLIDFSYVCGCPKGFIKEDDICISPYQINPKNISLSYTLRGESHSIDFVVYEKFAEYTSTIPRSIRYSSGFNYSRADFKLKAINEEEQEKFLMPLVIKIQNITNNKEDQARIAISIVQNIPFGISNKTFDFGNSKINYSRYPYEVLYDLKGVCGEKTDLLAFLLKELGYGTAFFYYPPYNHEALGIKCPLKESLMESGYCFVETTGPSIISDNKISYIGIGRLYANPEIYKLSDGIALSDDLYEYSDADKLIKIRDAIEKDGKINFFMHEIYKGLQEKYGLITEYYSQ